MARRNSGESVFSGLPHCGNAGSWQAPMEIFSRRRFPPARGFSMFRGPLPETSNRIPMTEALPAIGDCSADTATTPARPAYFNDNPATADLGRASIAPGTRRAYRGALGRLDEWLGGRVLDDHALSEWIAGLHGRGLSPSSTSLAVAACRFRAKMSGMENPAGPMTARTLAGIRRSSTGRGQGQVTGVTWEEADLVVDRAMEEGTVRGLPIGYGSVHAQGVINPERGQWWA